MIQAAVDLAAAADAAPFDVLNLDRSEGRGESAVAILEGELFLRERQAAVDAEMRPFFDQQDVAPGFGEQAGRDRTAGAGADDRDIAAQDTAKRRRTPVQTSCHAGWYRSAMAAGSTEAAGVSSTRSFGTSTGSRTTTGADASAC